MKIIGTILRSIIALVLAVALIPVIILAMVADAIVIIVRAKLGRLDSWVIGEVNKRASEFREKKKIASYDNDDECHAAIMPISKGFLELIEPIAIWIVDAFIDFEYDVLGI